MGIRNRKKILSFPETQAGWQKYPENPVLGGNLGTCFDVCLIRDQTKYRMWFSWRPKECIAIVESEDGLHWSDPQIVLKPNPASKWEDRINRPIVLMHRNQYHMWYTGQDTKHSWIGYATSPDGFEWTRQSSKPVLSPENRWESKAVMCPHVIWDDKLLCFKMWYSGGNQYEPNAIGYATSPDGISWNKMSKPVFTPNKAFLWEKDRVAACQVILWQNWYLMFYIGFSDIQHARIGIARSKDGITNWERLGSNPILSPTKNSWDHDACYKPFTLYDGQRWRLWYNGRHDIVEQIGFAEHLGEDLGFDSANINSV